MNRNIKLLILVLILSLIFISGCTKYIVNSSDNKETNSVTKINPEEFNNLIENEDVFVVDVHIPEQEHIPGTDAVIPFDELVNRLSELPDRNAKIVLYCRSGSMSNLASKTLSELGYKNVYDLVGGRNAWLKYENSQ